MHHYSVSAVLFAVLTLSASASACARGEIVVNTSPSFTVRVSNDYGPVVGLHILVTHFRVDEYSRAVADHRSSLEGTADAMTDIIDNTANARSAAARASVVNIKDYVDVIAVSVTDDKGEAQFHLEKLGNFTLEADHPAADFGDYVLNVSGDATSAVLDVKWPGTLILETRSVNGNIEDGLYKSTGKPLKQAKVSLHDLISYKEVAATATTETGAFGFSGISPGLYFLEVKAKEEGLNEPNGNIAIRVGPRAPRDSLSIAVHESDCGLSYDLVENKSKYKPVVCMQGGKQVPCPY